MTVNNDEKEHEPPRPKVCAACLHSIGRHKANDYPTTANKLAVAIIERRAMLCVRTFDRMEVVADDTCKDFELFGVLYGK